MPDRVAIVAPVRQHHQAGDLAQHLRGTLHVRLVAGHQLESDQLSLAVGHRVELGVAAALRLSEALAFKGLGKVAGILVHLDVGCVDDLDLVSSRRLHGRFDHPLEDPALGPAVVEAVDAVPLAVAFGKLVPLAAGDENPPDAAQRFEKIGRRPAFFTNVRLVLARVELIFLRAQTARPASLSQNSSKQRQSAGFLRCIKDLRRFSFCPHGACSP